MSARSNLSCLLSYLNWFKLRKIGVNYRAIKFNDFDNNIEWDSTYDITHRCRKLRW